MKRDSIIDMLNIYRSGDVPVITITKQARPIQFPKDEIMNENDRLVRGWLSVEVVDKENDLIPISELKKSLNVWMKRGGFITDSHSNKVVGKALRWWEDIHPESKKPGIIIEYIIFTDYSIDDTVWGEIKSGKRTGLSFGGRALGAPEIKENSETGGLARQLAGIESYEAASVDNPANQLASNIAVNFLAKSYKGENVKATKEEVIKALASAPGVQDVNALADWLMKQDATKGCGGTSDEKKEASEQDDVQDPVQTDPKEETTSETMKGTSNGQTAQHLNSNVDNSKSMDSSTGGTQMTQKDVKKQEEPKTNPKIDSEDKKEMADMNKMGEEQGQPPVPPTEAPPEPTLADVMGKLDQLIQAIAGGAAPAAPETMKSSEKDQPMQTSVDPSPKGGETKLPKADAGETDETAPGENDKVSLLTKENDTLKSQVANLTKSLEDINKRLGINPTPVTTPRPAHDITKKTATENSVDPTLQMMEDIRKGRMTPTEANQKAYADIKKHKSDMLGKVLGQA